MEVSEKAKMIAGKLYFASDPELVADRKAAKEAVRRINEEKDGKLREQLVIRSLGAVQGRVHIEAPFTFDYGYNISIGKNFYANFGNLYLDSCPITIGDNCMFGPNVQLYTASHPLEAQKRNSGQELAKPITIGDNVWIGGSAVLVPGVTIGNNVVIGAGSVVTGSFPDDVVIAGNPARVIKTIGEKDDQLTQARETIDQIDHQLVALLEQRMTAVSEVTAFKKQTGKAVLDTAREDAVLEKVKSLVEKEEYQQTIVETFRDIMKQSRNYQKERLKNND